MNALKRNRGSALAWAVCLLLVLAVLIAGMASIASAYQGRGARDRLASQAYLAATGAVEAVLELLDGVTAEIPFISDSYGNASSVPSDDAIRQMLEEMYPLFPLGEGSRVELTDFDFGLMPVDEARGYIERVDSTYWRVSVTAACGGVERTASALLELKITPAGQYRELSTFKAATLGDIFHASVINTLIMPSGDGQTGTLSAPGGPLYLGGVDPSGTSGGRELALDGALFTRETLGVSGENRGLVLADSTFMPVHSSVDLTGSLRGFGDVFLPSGELRGDGFVLTPGLLGVPDGLSLRSLSGSATLDLAELPSGSRLYIMMGSAATLTIKGQNPDALVYIYCPEGSMLIADLSIAPLSLNGAIIVDTLLVLPPAHGDYQVEIRFSPPQDDAALAFNSGQMTKIYPAGAFDYTWSFVRYE